MDYSGSPELLNASLFVVSSHNKHMFDEIELDIMNYQYQSMSYLPVLKAETDDTDTKVDNSWYRNIKTKFSDCLLYIFLNNLLKETILSEFAKVLKCYLHNGLGKKRQTGGTWHDNPISAADMGYHVNVYCIWPVSALNQWEFLLWVWCTIWFVFKCMWGKIIKPEQKPKKHTVRGFWLTIIGTTAIILHVPGF